MKTITLIVILFFSFTFFAQNNLYKITEGSFLSGYEYGWQYNQYSKEKDKYKKNRIKKIEISKYAKNKKNRKSEYFDDEGRIIKSEAHYGKNKFTTEYIYDEKGNLSILKYTNHKGKVTQTKYTYNTDGKILTSERINKKGNYYGRKRTYNTDGKITSFLIFEKDRENPKKELHYTYYPDGSKKQTVYKVKGKVKYTWDFECSEEGELLSKDKKESKICVLKEEDENGNTITWNREFHKGELRKVKTVKTKNDKWLYTEYYNEDDKLISSSKLKEDGGIIRKTRNKKGEMIKSYESFSNSDGKIIKQINYNKKWGFTIILNYEDDLLKSEIRIYKRRFYVNEYTYSTRS